MDFEIEVEIVANAMLDAAQMAKRYEIRGEDCRVMARVALQAIAQARRAAFAKEQGEKSDSETVAHQPELSE